MKCECCMDCYKIDCCDGRCNFQCEKCNMNKNNKTKGELIVKEIYRTYEDTEVVHLATNVECPYCGNSWQEYDKNECGETYTLICDEEYEGCGKVFKMCFDAD